MEKIRGESAGRSASIRKVAASSLIGTAIEWYDFFLYGTAAALVLNVLFFPNFSPLAGTLAASGTYAVRFSSPSLWTARSAAATGTISGASPCSSPPC
jgi:hypothetical protein